MRSSDRWVFACGNIKYYHLSVFVYLLVDKKSLKKIHDPKYEEKYLHAVVYMKYKACKCFHRLYLCFLQIDGLFSPYQNTATACIKWQSFSCLIYVKKVHFFF